MSRLTDPNKDYSYSDRVMNNPKIRDDFKLLSILNQALQEYENIGEPSELRKVTFCKDCRRFRKAHSGEVVGAYKDYCFTGAYDSSGYQVARYVNEDDFCSWGELREERENE